MGNLYAKQKSDCLGGGSATYKIDHALMDIQKKESQNKHKRKMKKTRRINQRIYHLHMKGAKSLNASSPLRVIWTPQMKKKEQTQFPFPNKWTPLKSINV